jgi:hypothetical protein
MSEAFKQEGKPKPDYVVATQICYACKAIEERRAELEPKFRAAAEHEEKETGYALNRDRIWSFSVFTRDEAIAIQQAQQQQQQQQK